MPGEATISGLQGFLSQLDAVGFGAALVLLAMSLSSWYLIFAKAWHTWTVRRRSQAIVARFWDARNLTEAIDLLRNHYAADPAARLALGAIVAVQHYQQHCARAERLGDQSSVSDLVVRTLRQVLTRENGRLEAGLSVLASIGAVAPFVGLFGTVSGIYRALLGVGAGGLNTLDQVAGPVGEALIMTAAGLAVAIPAVLAYNAFARANRVTVAELDGFAHDLHTYLTTGAKLDMEPAPALPQRPALKEAQA